MVTTVVGTVRKSGGGNSSSLILKLIEAKREREKDEAEAKAEAEAQDAQNFRENIFNKDLAAFLDPNVRSDLSARGLGLGMPGELRRNVFETFGPKQGRLIEESIRKQVGEEDDQLALENFMKDLDLTQPVGTIFKQGIAAGVPPNILDSIVDNIFLAKKEKTRVGEAGATVKRGEKKEATRVGERKEDIAAKKAAQLIADAFKEATQAFLGRKEETRIGEARAKVTRGQTAIDLKATERDEDIAAKEAEQATANEFKQAASDRADADADRADKQLVIAERKAAIADKAEERAETDEARKAAAEKRKEADEARAKEQELRDIAAASRQAAVEARLVKSSEVKEAEREAFSQAMLDFSVRAKDDLGAGDPMIAAFEAAADAGPNQGPKVIAAAQQLKDQDPERDRIDVPAFDKAGNRVNLSVPKFSTFKRRTAIAKEQGVTLGIPPTGGKPSGADVSAGDLLDVREMVHTDINMGNARRALAARPAAVRSLTRRLLEPAEGVLFEMPVTGGIILNLAESLFIEKVLDGNTVDQAVQLSEDTARGMFARFEFLPAGVPQTQGNAIQHLFSLGAEDFELSLFYRRSIEALVPDGLSEELFKRYVENQAQLMEVVIDPDSVENTIAMIINKVTTGVLQGRLFTGGVQ